MILGPSGALKRKKGKVSSPTDFGELPLMTITIEPEDPRSPEAQGLLSAFIEEVRKRYDEPPADVGYFDPNLVSVPRRTFLVVRLEGKAVGCGALIPIEDEVAEIKRMFVVPGERGHGIARKILEELERFARDFDYDAIRLETGVKQPESIALYGKSGFYRVPNFPPFENDATAVCFKKRVKGTSTHRRSSRIARSIGYWLLFLPMRPDELERKRTVEAGGSVIVNVRKTKGRRADEDLIRWAQKSGRFVYIGDAVRHTHYQRSPLVNPANSFMSIRVMESRGTYRSRP